MISLKHYKPRSNKYMKYMCILPWVSNIHPTPPPPPPPPKKKKKKKTLQYVHLPTLLHKHESKSMLGNYALITKG